MSSMKLTTTRMEMRPVDALIPYKQNARIHTEAQILSLRASLRTFGFVAPILIDADGNVLAGHGRLAAAKAEGFSLVPCVLVEHLSALQRRAYILADNRLAEQAEWDAELVSYELQALRDSGFDVALTGFSEDDILPLSSEEPFEDDFDDFEPPEEPVTRRGDLWLLGQHRLLCGDATDPSDVLRLAGGTQAHLLLTDPPYNVDVTGGTERHLKIRNDDLPDASFSAFLADFLSASLTVLEKGSSYYIWHADGEPGLVFRSALHSAGLRVRQCLVWVKNSATLSRQDYQWQHEPCLHGETDDADVCCEWDEHDSCLYGWRDGKPHLWRSDRRQTTVLTFDRPSRSAEHPTMKPVRLFAYLVFNSTMPGATVLDPFAGSGTTAIACEQIGRRALMMELDPRYCDVIVRRWESFTGKTAVRVDSAKT